MKPNDLQLAASVDLFGALKAQAASINDRLDEVKEILIASNQAEIKGDLYQASVKFNEPKPSVDYKAIVEDAIAQGAINEKVLKSAKYQKVRVPFYSVSLYDL